jgi:hypothetical protein
MRSGVGAFCPGWLPEDLLCLPDLELADFPPADLVPLEDLPLVDLLLADFVDVALLDFPAAAVFVPDDLAVEPDFDPLLVLCFVDVCAGAF